MAATLLDGQIFWEMERDELGYRTYTVQHRVQCETTDGPRVAMLCPGLPKPGDTWHFDNDQDVWCICRYNMRVVQTSKDGDPNKQFIVEQQFSNKPGFRCPNAGTGTGDAADNPILEPDKISGSFIKYQKEAAKDKDGNLILNGAFEQLRGPPIEFDDNRPTVVVEQNVRVLEWDLICILMDHVNDDTMWDRGPRCVKLSNARWEMVRDGNCDVYYKRILEFDINANTFDRDVPDEATKVLHGRWKADGSGTWELVNINGAPPDPTNPRHYDRYQDSNGNWTKVALSAATPGTPATSLADIRRITVRKYSEANLFQLGVPTVIGP